MKTTLKTFAAGLLLTVSVLGVNASEISTSGLKITELNDEEMVIETWMVNADLFETSNLKAKISAGLSEIVEVADYELVMENWMTDAELFESSEIETSICTVAQFASLNSVCSSLVEEENKVSCLTLELSKACSFTDCASTN